MSEAETLTKILENLITTNAQMVETLLRMEERQQKRDAALVQILDRIDTRLDDLQVRTRDIDARIAADNRALAEILKYVVDTTTRTEQMTARVLTEVAGRGGSH
jgi:hypothetical protein